MFLYWELFFPLPGYIFMFPGLRNISVCYFTEACPNFCFPFFPGGIAGAPWGDYISFRNLRQVLVSVKWETKRIVEPPCKKTDCNWDWKDEVQVLKCFAVSTAPDIKGVEKKKMMVKLLDAWPVFQKTRVAKPGYKWANSLNSELRP